MNWGRCFENKRVSNAARQSAIAFLIALVMKPNGSILCFELTEGQREVNSTNRETSVLLPYSSGTTSGTTPSSTPRTTPSSTPRTITGTSALKPEHLYYRPKYLRTTSEVHPKNIWHYSPPSRLDVIPYVIKQPHSNRAR